MNILLLRNQEDLEKSVQNIKTVHQNAYIYTAPVFEVHFNEIPHDILGRPLIITSKNALRSLKESGLRSDYPLFVLGESSCQYAEKIGFKDIIRGGFNAWELAEKVKEYENVFHSLYYLHGDVTRFDIKKYLSFVSEQKVDKICAYKLEKIEKPFKDLPPQLFKEELYVFVYSIRQAQALVEEVGDFSGLKAICISSKVASSLEDYDFASISYAKKTTEKSMIALLSRQLLLNSQ